MRWAIEIARPGQEVKVRPLMFGDSVVSRMVGHKSSRTTTTSANQVTQSPDSAARAVPAPHIWTHKGSPRTNRRLPDKSDMRNVTVRWTLGL